MLLLSFHSTAVSVQVWCSNAYKNLFRLNRKSKVLIRGFLLYVSVNKQASTAMFGYFPYFSYFLTILQLCIQILLIIVHFLEVEG